MKDYTSNSSLQFDPSDLRGMRRIMDEHSNSKTMFRGMNEHGETVYISVFLEKIVVRTLQKNGWCRLNTYYRDGSKEEGFDGRHS